MEAGNDKFDQINGIFSQFSEENKGRLLEIAESLLKVQKAGEASLAALRNESTGHCPREERMFLNSNFKEG